MIKLLVSIVLALLVAELHANVIQWPSSKFPRDCNDLLLSGFEEDGVYTIYPYLLYRPLKVYCDMTTDGGGWTVFQRRQDGTVNFYRTWDEYRDGFGDVNGELWLGNKYINAISEYSTQELRIDLEDWEENSANAKYAGFYVDSEANKFQITVGSYSGTAGDGLTHVNGQYFTTQDRDNDEEATNCAQTYPSGFWFKGCFFVNLNGLYSASSAVPSYARGVIWQQWKDYYYSLKFSEMKMRPMRLG